MKFIKYILYSLFILPIHLSAQMNHYLSYDEAIKTALQHNFDILIATNDKEVAQIQNTIGNAGFLPKVDLLSSGSISNNATKQKFSSGQEVQKNNVISKNITSGAYITYTLFDGFKMFATKDKLQLLEEQSDLNFKIQMENVIEQVSLSYYQIVRQNQMIHGILSSIDVANERLNLAEKKLKIGSGSNVEVLQAKLDLNSLKSNLIANKNILKQNKISLSTLLQDEGFSNYEVDTNFHFDDIASIENIFQSIDQINYGLAWIRKNKKINEQILKELKSQQLPKLDLNTNYQFARNQSGAGLLLLNQNLGYTPGFTLTWNIFNGNKTNIQMKVAKINIRNNDLLEHKLKNSLYADAKTAYSNWLGNKEALELEEQNISLAEQSLHIMLERMKVGLGNYLETKESQNAYEQAITRLVNARYDLKESEIKLKKITGNFVK